MKTVFKAGQKVFDYPFGWGEVEEIWEESNTPIIVQFEHRKVSYTENGAILENVNPTLSFTEYTLEGFSQEPPIDYNDYIGKWGMFWDEGDESRIIDKLKQIGNGNECMFIGENSAYYENFRPFTDEQVKELGL